MTDLPLPRGVRDLMPNEAIFKNEVLARVERLMQKHGFTTIETPAIESLKVLYAKGGIGEDTKLVYELKSEDSGLRYDNTVPLARFVSTHQELPLPFKRYSIGKAWRREEPQHLRYREFSQIDADIVGGMEGVSDAEVIALGCKILEELDIDYMVKISDRRIIDAILTKLQVPIEKHIVVMRTIDKLDKVGIDGVAKLLSEDGIESSVSDSLINLITAKGSNEDKLKLVSSMVGSTSAAMLSSVLDMLGHYKLNGSIEVDFSIIRGLDYYTGIVFEFKRASIKESLGGGGRYDKLIGLYGGRDIPAVGFAMGVDRLLDILNFSASPILTYAKIFVVTVSEKNYPYALEVANKLRAMGIATDINTSSKNIANQLKYANSMHIPFAIIIGDAEEKEQKVKIRNLIDGSEVIAAIDEVPRLIKG
ncbi:MAG: histidine--tRNA ligase [Candidatus Micrarchaeia archaeon]